MSRKVVEIVQDGSYRAGQPAQVQVADGNSIEFKNGAGGGTDLVLTPDTRSILSPTPESTVVRIAAGASISFDFKSPSAIVYCCQLLAEGTEPLLINCDSSIGEAELRILNSEERSLGSHTGRGL